MSNWNLAVMGNKLFRTKLLTLMNSRIIDVKPEKNYTLHVWFKNGEESIFDEKPYLGYELFYPLKDTAVQPSHSTVHWASEADFCPDTVYVH